jgi:Ca2+-binding RTX toxin-like protein
MTINLNGGDDYVSGGTANQGVTFNGGAGKDEIVTSSAVQNTLNGGPDDDILRPVGINRDFVNGGPGNDRILYVQGADELHGDDGIDTLETSSAAHSISLDGVANDGTGGIDFNVHPDVENVIGGDQADTLIGSAAANALEGGKGADIIDGLGGADTLRGGEGDDTIDARDGVADSIDCGVGNDTATIDPADLPVTGCETVRLPDEDLDGVTAPVDCDDHNPAIKPGAADVPGDGIDQDCSGADTPAQGPGPGPDPGPGPGPVVDTTPKTQPAGVRNRWQVGNRTKVVTLEVRDAPTGAKVRVTCKGGGCAFKRRTATVGRDGKARFTRRFKGRALKPGTVIEVRITAQGFNGKVVRYTIRKGKLPRSRVLCLRPGTSKPVASC